jgi:predicted kinase
MPGVLSRDFLRGKQRADMRRTIRQQNRVSPLHLAMMEIRIESALIARRTSKGYAGGPSDADLETMMLEWSVIREEIQETGQ